jgi:hypothetical protein
MVLSHYKGLARWHESGRGSVKKRETMKGRKETA